MFIWILAISSFCTTASLYVELALHLEPCLLCCVQRGIYIGLIPAASLGMFTDWKRIARIACIVLLAAGTVAATYHTLVQLEIVEDRCRTARPITDLASYKAVLIGPQTGCSDKFWKIGNIPAPAFNAVLLAALLGILVSRRRTLKTSGI